MYFKLLISVNKFIIIMSNPAFKIAIPKQLFTRSFFLCLLKIVFADTNKSTDIIICSLFHLLISKPQIPDKCERRLILVCELLLLFLSMQSTVKGVVSQVMDLTTIDNVVIDKGDLIRPSNRSKQLTYVNFCTFTVPHPRLTVCIRLK